MRPKVLPIFVCVLTVCLPTMPGRAKNHTDVGHGAETCLRCHGGGDYTVKGKNMAPFLHTLHPQIIQGPPTPQETPVLTTEINGRNVSIFDSRTDGYDAYVAPWADYFREEYVEFTLGSRWKQLFMTRVVPETVAGPQYSGLVRLLDNEYVVMGIQWNVREARWQDYHGPTGLNDWYAQERSTRKKCGACHTTLFDPQTGTWADVNSSFVQKGLSCESCHRPVMGGDILRDPRRLQFVQRLELCGSCHSRGRSVDAHGVSPGQYHFPHSDVLQRGFGVGDRLDDFYLQTTAPEHFWPNGAHGTNGNSRSNHQQYNDTLLSKHAAAEVGCMACHGAHNLENQHQIRLPGNELCTSCHDDLVDAQAYRSHCVHYPDVAACIDCHMPYTAQSMNAFDIRSHTFKIISPATTIAMGGDPEGFSGALDTHHIPNSCNSSCHNGWGPGPLKTNRIAQLGVNYIRTLNGRGLSADLNGDGTVDFQDLAILSSEWLQAVGSAP